MNNNLKNQIKAFATELMRKNQLFTAYDVTNYLRLNLKNTSDTIYHSEVKDIIASIDLDSLNYERVLITVGSDNAQAYLYKNVFSPQSDYVGLKFKTALDTSVAPVNKLVSAISNAQKLSNTPTRNAPTQNFNKKGNVRSVTPDVRNRITVESKFSRMAGFYPGTKVYVYRKEDENELILSSYQLQGKTLRTELTVDKYFNLRIPMSSYWIKNFGLAKSATYNIGTNTITIDLQ